MPYDTFLKIIVVSSALVHHCDCYILFSCFKFDKISLKFTSAFCNASLLGTGTISIFSFSIPSLFFRDNGLCKGVIISSFQHTSSLGPSLILLDKLQPLLLTTLLPIPASQTSASPTHEHPYRSDNPDSSSPPARSYPQSQRPPPQAADTSLTYSPSPCPHSHFLQSPMLISHHLDRWKARKGCRFRRRIRRSRPVCWGRVAWW